MHPRRLAELMNPLPASRLLPLLTLAAFASSASFRVCDPMLPALASVFTAPASAVAWIITAFAIGYGLMQLVYGPLGERFDRLRMIMIAASLCALTSLGSALAPGLQSLVGWRLLTGIVAAGIIPLSMAAIADAVPAEARQAALARFFSGQILGMVAGQYLGGVFADLGAWRWAFGVLSVLYLAVAYALWRLAMLSGTGQRPARPRASLLSLYATALRMLYAPDTRWVLAAFFVEAVLVFGVLAFMPLFLHTRFGWNLSMSSLPLALYGAGGLVFSLLASRLGPRLNQRIFPLSAACLIAVANLIYLSAEWAGWVVAGSLLAGFGYYQLHNALLFQITQRVPQARSLALSLSVSLFFLGQSVGVAVAGWMVDHGRIDQVFALIALLMPGLGLWVGQQVRRL